MVGVEAPRFVPLLSRRRRGVPVLLYHVLLHFVHLSHAGIVHHLFLHLGVKLLIFFISLHGQLFDPLPGCPLRCSYGIIKGPLCCLFLLCPG